MKNSVLKTKQPLRISKKEIDKLMDTLRRDFKENGSMHGKYIEPYKNIQSIINQQREYILYGIYKTNEDLLKSAAYKK